MLKTIKRFDEKNGAKQELLPEYDSEEEKDYARKLFRAAILNADEYQRYMSESSLNWDFSRLAYMDVIIMPPPPPCWAVSRMFVISFPP